MTELDFGEFRSFLRNGDIDAAKRLLTPATAQARDRDGRGVLWYLCSFGSDDADLLYHFLELGATLELDNSRKRPSPLHAAAWRGNFRQLHTLLDLGIPANIFDGNRNTPLHYSLGRKKCSRLLLDRGAKLSLLKKDLNIPDWAIDFVLKREKTRKTSVAILGLLKCNSEVTRKNGKDVLCMVAKCVWSSRGT